jgi:hypothetical protein
MEQVFTQTVLTAMAGILMCVALPELVYAVVKKLRNFFRKHRTI